MRAGVRTQTEEVAGGRLATSAQPPRATPIPAATASFGRTPRPVRSVLSLDTSRALREGLRCLTARRPLPETIFQGLQHQFREHGRRIR